MTDSRPRNREATEAALVRAARELIETHPYEAIRTREIADLIGCNHGLITQYFATKLGLFTVVMHDMAAEMNEVLKAGATANSLITNPTMAVYWRLVASLLGAGLDPSQVIAEGSPLLTSMSTRVQAITGLDQRAAMELTGVVILAIGGYHVFAEPYLPILSADGSREGAAETIQRVISLVITTLATDRSSSQ